MASTVLPRYQDTVAFSPLELLWEKKQFSEKVHNFYKTTSLSGKAKLSSVLLELR